MLLMKDLFSSILVYFQKYSDSQVLSIHIMKNMNIEIDV